jgi:hypothetical protein
MNAIRGKISDVTSGARRVASFIGRLTNFGKLPFVQQYGLHSRPLNGAEGVMLRTGDNMVIIASGDDRYTITLQPGEVALATDEGDKIHLARDHKITVEAAGDALKPGEITINAKGAGCKVTVLADAIELTSEQVGALSEKVLMGERFQAFFDAHTQTGGFVAPVAPPVLQSALLNNTPLSHLSTVAKIGTVPVEAP